MKNELEVLRQLQPTRHQNIANVIEVVEDKASIIAILEYCGGGSLQRALQKGGACDRPHSVGLGDTRARPIAYQIAAALAHMHGAGVAHRDVKPENVLFVDASQRQVKLCDFGFAVACGNKRVRTVCGTPQYMAPARAQEAASNRRLSSLVFSSREAQAATTARLSLATQEIAGASLQRREPYAAWACDMWAYGALVFELLEGKPAFRGTSLPQLNIRILRASHEAFTAASPPAARQLLKKLFVLEPTSRLSAREALASSWFPTAAPVASVSEAAIAGAPSVDVL